MNRLKRFIRNRIEMEGTPFKGNSSKFFNRFCSTYTGKARYTVLAFSLFIFLNFLFFNHPSVPNSLTLIYSSFVLLLVLMAGFFLSLLWMIYSFQRPSLKEFKSLHSFKSWNVFDVVFVLSFGTLLFFLVFMVIPYVIVSTYLICFSQRFYNVNYNSFVVVPSAIISIFGFVTSLLVGIKSFKMAKQEVELMYPQEFPESSIVS